MTMKLEVREEILSSRLAHVLCVAEDLAFPAIIAAIESDHAEIRKLLHKMKADGVAVSERQRLFPHFAALLKAHTAAEEKVVYACALGIEALREETYEGYVEHGIVGALLRQIERLPASDEWTAQVKVLGELVELHMQQEEAEFVPSLRNCARAEEERRRQKDLLALRMRTKARRTTAKRAVLLAS